MPRCFASGRTGADSFTNAFPARRLQRNGGGSVREQSGKLPHRRAGAATLRPWRKTRPRGDLPRSTRSPYRCRQSSAKSRQVRISSVFACLRACCSSSRSRPASSSVCACLGGQEIGSSNLPVPTRSFSINGPSLERATARCISDPFETDARRAPFRQRQTMLPSSMALPISAPAPAPMIVPSVFDPPGAMMLPSTPPPMPPMIRPVVPSSRRQ